MTLIIFSLLKDWDVSLEEAAQSAADSCDPVRERGMNIFYNTTVLPQDSQAVFFQVLENWLSNGNENVLQVSFSGNWNNTNV